VSRLAAALCAGALAGAAAATEVPPGCGVPAAGCRARRWCGSVRRPLDPARPGGTAIDVQFAVLPALARNRKPDPVFFFAGGPGRARSISPARSAAMLGRCRNRRDIVLIDQRGTGRSAPLRCDDDDPTRPLAEQVDPARRTAELQPAGSAAAAAARRPALLHDVDRGAGRRRGARALGAERIDIVGGSYGTRARSSTCASSAAVRRRARRRRAARHGAAGGVLADNQAASTPCSTACDADAACRARYPALRAQWQRCSRACRARGRSPTR
jgi:pimeloyl-ACP methyl ester carboxylesterase